MSDRRDRDPTEHFLVQRFAPEHTTDEPCPGPGLIAGYAEGRLLPEESERVETHVARCETCRALVAELLPDEREAVRRPRMWPWVAVVAAAAAVVVAAVFVRGRDGDPPLSTENRLFAAAADLANAHEELFGEFVPLTKDERRARRSRERGGLTAIYPAGLVLDTRPRFRWEPAPGVDEYTVSLFAADGEVWRVTTNRAELEFPKEEAELKPGQQYSWEVAYRGGPFGDDNAQRPFSVATPSQRSAFERGVRRIETETPKEVADLLKAHYAIRGKLYGEAETAARGFLKAHPKDVVARETLFQVLELLGSSEADDLLEADR